MATSPQELAPQYDHTLSQCVRKLEERLAEAEHRQAKQAKTIQQLRGSLQHWKRLHDADQEQIVELQAQTMKCWHCNGEVQVLKDGWVCRKCGQHGAPFDKPATTIEEGRAENKPWQA